MNSRLLVFRLDNLIFTCIFYYIEQRATHNMSNLEEAITKLNELVQRPDQEKLDQELDQELDELVKQNPDQEDQLIQLNPELDLDELEQELNEPDLDDQELNELDLDLDDPELDEQELNELEQDYQNLVKF